MKIPARSGLSIYVAKITKFLARIIAHRTKMLILAALAITALSIFIIIKRKNFDSDVGLKEFNSEFAQARQLVFGFLAENGHADDVEAFKTHFIEELGNQPW